MTCFYIYKMTHIPTGRVYIGRHTTPSGSSPETDGYTGSGLVWKQIYKKHGGMSSGEFEKKILYVTRDFEDVCEFEKHFIAAYKVLYGDQCVNIAAGGKTSVPCPLSEPSMELFDGTAYVNKPDDIQEIYGRKWKNVVEKLSKLCRYMEDFCGANDVKVVGLPQTSVELVKLFGSHKNVCNVTKKAIEVGLVRVVNDKFCPGRYSKLYAFNPRKATEIDRLRAGGKRKAPNSGS